MSRTLLDATKIKATTCPEGKAQSFIFDTKSPRLALRITPGGKKTFVFESKLKGKTIRLPIGPVDTWKLSEARRAADAYQVTIGQGIDPREVKRKKQAAKEAEKAAQEAANKEAAKEAAKREKYSLEALLTVYVAYLDGQGKSRAAGAAKSAFKCHVPPDVAALPACEITSHHIANFVRRVFETGKERQAGVLRAYLAAAFTAARKAPFDGRLPSELIPFEIKTNPVDVVPAISVKARDRHLSVDELAAYVRHLGDDSLPVVALRLALYAGGQRMAQLVRAEVSDYEPATQSLRLLDGKGKRTEPRVHLLPLAPVAAGIVEGLIKKAGKGPLFKSLHTDTPGKACKGIAAAMGGEPFDLRDIRRTCETTLAGQLKITTTTLSHLLSHGLSGVQAKHYDRYTYLDEKRAALLQWERYLERLRSGEKEQKVVNLRRA
jgi:integrase